MRQVDKRAFGARVVQRREKLGLSQAALADAVGMKQQGVDNIEHGVVARPRLLLELAATLKTTDVWLLWKDGPEDAALAETPDFDRVPLLSWVSAGDLIDAESQIPVEDVLLLAFADLGPGDFFALRVSGDSMDRVSPDGSVIVVNRRDRELIADRAYVFWQRGEGTTYKLWQPGPPTYLAPHSWNGTYKPKFVKGRRDFEVVGRVKRSVLDL